MRGGLWKWVRMEIADYDAQRITHMCFVSESFALFWLQDLKPQYQRTTHE